MATDQFTIGNLKKYDVQVVDVQPNDVILLHISEALSLREIQSIKNEVQSEFPENRVLIVNRKVLEGMTVVRHGNAAVNLIDDPVDVDKIFDDIMKGKPNDFLH